MGFKRIERLASHVAETLGLSTEDQALALRAARLCKFDLVSLMVDADTKVFPDSLTHMISAMVKDPDVMGLCGTGSDTGPPEAVVPATSRARCASPDACAE